MNAATRKAMKQANKALYELGRTYHDGLPISTIDSILTSNGFNATEPAIYCGRDGQVIEPVSKDIPRTYVYLSMSWHKMEVTGRYEIVAYLS